MRVLGKIIVVTGAGSGIGRELVRELARRGAHPIGVDLNAASLAETAALVPGVRTQALDIADRGVVEALPATVGAVDGLINCAGIIQPFSTINTLDYATIDRVFDVNWRGTLYMTKAFLPPLLTRPEAHIVNVSSMGGFMPFPGQAIYGASKAAIKLMTEALYSELAATPVRVSVVFPGAVNTNIMQNSGVQARPGTEGQAARIHQADAAARDILNGMERDAFRILVGKDAKALDVMYRMAPRWAARFIAKKMRHLLPEAAE